MDNYLAVLDALSDPILAVDAACLMAHANPAFCRLVRRQLESITGRSITLVCPAQSRQEITAWIACGFAGAGLEAPHVISCTLLSGSGDEIEAEISFSMVPHMSGSVAVLICRDSRSRMAALRREEQRRRQLEFTGAIANNLAGGVCVFDRQGRIAFLNPAAEEMLGRWEADVMGSNLHALLHAHRLDASQDGEECVLLRALQAERIVEVDDELFSRSDGSLLPVALSVSSLSTGAYSIARVLTFQDVTERRKAEGALRESEERYRTLVETSADGILLGALDGSILAANTRASQLYGYPNAEQLIGVNAFEMMATDERMRAMEHAWSLVETGSEQKGVEYSLLRRNGSTFQAEVSAAVVRDRGGNPTAITAVVRDITERKRAQEVLRQSEESFRLLFARSPLPMWVYDAETLEFLEVNDAATTHYGFSREEFLAMPMSAITHAGDVFVSHAEIPTSQQETESVYRTQHRRKDGHIIDAEVVSHLITFAGRRSILMLAQDITEREAMTEALRQRAFHDPLTGLPNRSLFVDRLEQSILRAQRDHSELAVFYLDLDRFKAVNDAYGHGIGDMLLQSVGRRMAHTLRDSDTIARLGGDEFTALLPATSLDGAVEAARKIAETVRQPFSFQDKQIQTATSIGIAVYPHHASEPVTLLDLADAALYAAKRGGHDYQVYAPEKGLMLGARVS